MFVFDFLKKATEDFSWVPGFVAIVGAISLAFGTVRLKIYHGYRACIDFFTSPTKIFHLANELNGKVSRIEIIADNSAAKIQKMEELIGYNGGSGLMDSVGYLLGYWSNDFWLRDQPGFIATDKGDNVDCTHAYCRLLGLSAKEDLLNKNWRGFVDKQEYSEHLNEFVDVSSKREVFRREMSFRNSSNHSVGTWIVIASPISSNKAKTARYIGMLYPADEIAINLCKSNGWAETPPL
jgi:hypothetical protein